MNDTEDQQKGIWAIRVDDEIHLTIDGVVVRKFPRDVTLREVDIVLREMLGDDHWA